MNCKNLFSALEEEIKLKFWLAPFPWIVVYQVWVLNAWLIFDWIIPFMICKYNFSELFSIVYNDAELKFNNNYMALS
jgi:hypothetical protein